MAQTPGALVCSWISPAAYHDAPNILGHVVRKVRSGDEEVEPLYCLEDLMCMVQKRSLKCARKVRQDLLADVENTPGSVMVVNTENGGIVGEGKKHVDSSSVTSRSVRLFASGTLCARHVFPAGNLDRGSFALPPHWPWP
jgi:hypothetical protein